jgi:ABC-2 type transport system ATP-binding protein
MLSELEEILEDILLLDHGTECLHLPVLELKELAVGIRGNAQAVLCFVEGKETIYKEGFGKGSLYVVLRKGLIHQQLEQIRLSGLDVLPVSTDDLCVYLTATTKGGIDDVFKR